MSTPFELYIVDLVQRTHEHRNVAVGREPARRAGAAKAWARVGRVAGPRVRHPRRYQGLCAPGSGHRLILEPELWNSRAAIDRILDEIVSAVPVPVVKGL